MLAIKTSDFRRVVQAAIDQGWTVERTRRGHWRFVPPDKDMAPLVASGSPSDHRAHKNMVSDLKKRGLKV